MKEQNPSFPLMGSVEFVSSYIQSFSPVVQESVLEARLLKLKLASQRVWCSLRWRPC